MFFREYEVFLRFFLLRIRDLTKPLAELGPGYWLVHECLRAKCLDPSLLLASMLSTAGAMQVLSALKPGTPPICRGPFRGPTSPLLEAHNRCVRHAATWAIGSLLCTSWRKRQISGSFEPVWGWDCGDLFCLIESWRRQSYVRYIRKKGTVLWVEPALR